MEESLRDIHLPIENFQGSFPLGIQILAIIVFIALLTLSLALYQYFKPTAKKQALAIFNQIKEEYELTNNGANCAKKLSILLRRLAITQDKNIAGTTGILWLGYLDQGLSKKHVKCNEFKEGAGSLLITAPYQERIENHQIHDLLTLCKKWILTKSYKLKNEGKC